jgi:hypothetical protein
VPVPALVVLGAIGLVAVLVAVLLRMERRRLAARDADLARDAAQRGWRYEASKLRGRRTERWQGTGPSGPWTAEVVEQRRRKGPPTCFCRWWNGAADASPPTAGPVILLMALGEEVAAPFTLAPGGAAPGDGVLAGVLGGALRMALAMALDFRFGASSSLSAFQLQRVDRDRPIVDGYAVLSDDPARVTARLTPGFVAAVRQALPPRVWNDGPIRHPWIGLAGDRVAVAGVSRREPRAIDVAALVQAGGLLAQHR